MIKKKSRKNNIIKYLGVDWGEKRIGLAFGDSESGVAVPFRVVASISEIFKAVKDEEVDEVVIGTPLKMQNVELRMQNEFLEFLELLKKKVDVPVTLIDERLSSKGVDNLKGDKKSKAERDAVAAMLILQTYIDTKAKKH